MTTHITNTNINANNSTVIVIEQNEHCCDKHSPTYHKPLCENYMPTISPVSGHMHLNSCEISRHLDNPPPYYPQWVVQPQQLTPVIQHDAVVHTIPTPNTLYLFTFGVVAMVILLAATKCKNK